MVEARAVEILTQELQNCPDFSDSLNRLAVLVKWGQNDLVQLGNLRDFLKKYPEVFVFDGHSVKLANPPRTQAGASKSKGGMQAPTGAPTSKGMQGAPPGLAPPKAPLGSKAGFPKPSGPPGKSGYGDYGDDDAAEHEDGSPPQKGEKGSWAMPESKARRVPPPSAKGSKGSPDDAAGGFKGGKGAAPSKGSGAPTSKAKWAGAAPAQDNGDSAEASTTLTFNQLRQLRDAKAKGGQAMEVDDESDGKGSGYPSGKGKGKVVKGGKGYGDEDADEDGSGDSYDKGGSYGKGKGKASSYGKADDGATSSKGSSYGKADDGATSSKGSSYGKAEGGATSSKGSSYGKADEGYEKGGKGSKDNGKGGKYAPYADSKGGKKGGASTLSPEERKRRLAADGLGRSEAHLGIEVFKTAGTEIELGVLSKRLVPGDEARENSQRCLSSVRSAVSASGSNAQVEICGSYAQGTEVDGSAIDLALRFSPGTSPEEKDNFARELRQRLEAQGNGFEVSDSSENFPHTTSPFAVSLQGASQPVVAHVLLENILVDRKSPPLDIVVKNLCDSHEASYELVRLVKLWSENHNLANQHEGFMNGVAWTLLVVFFLQKQKLIPPYSILESQGQVQPATSDVVLSVQLQSFFEFLCERGAAARRGVSVYHGQEIDGPGILCIEDPAEIAESRAQRSLSQSLGESQWTRILDEAKRALTRIKVRPGRWFHWAEVFDPSDRKPQKTMGLAQYLRGEAPTEEAPDYGGKGMSKGKGFDGKSFGGKGKDSDGKGKDLDGKGGKDFDGKGDGKSDGKGSPGGKDFDSKGGYSDGKGKDYGKDSSKGKDFDGKGGSFGKDDSKGASFGKDDGKGYGKFKGSYKGGKPY